MMPIGDVARRAGIRASAVRYYERLGLLAAPDRRNGRRRYTEDVLLRLEAIRVCRSAGFSLRETQELFTGKPYSAQMRRLATKKLGELDGVIERAQTAQSLLRAALRCKCLTLEECGRRLRSG